MTRVIFIVGCMAMLLGCSQHILPTAQIKVGARALLVELAFEPKTRAKGLMYRDSLHKDEGMLFIYPDSAPRSFWMKNTRMPLSIAFADKAGVIFHIADMQALSTKHTECTDDAKFALEVNKGWFESNQIVIGDTLSALPESMAR
jgi:uncharacterized membrane protein (UPF0127 family)